jgi:hypothetical protein
MKTKFMKKALMLTTIMLTIVLSSAFTSEKQSTAKNYEDDYGFLYHYFFLSSQKSINSEDDIYYICVSDPIKNWDNFSYNEKDEIMNSFRRKVNLEAGDRIISDYTKPQFGKKSNWEKFKTYDDCRVGIQDLINDQLEIHKDRLNNCSSKTIKIELYKN